MLEIEPNNFNLLHESEKLFSDSFKTLLKRSGNDPQLAEVMMDFLRALNMKAHAGFSGSELTTSRIDKIKEELGYTASALRMSEGGSVTDAQKVSEYIQKKGK
jgi:hypothetical protein